MNSQFTSENEKYKFTPFNDFTKITKEKCFNTKHKACFNVENIKIQKHKLAFNFNQT